VTGLRQTGGIPVAVLVAVGNGFQCAIVRAFALLMPKERAKRAHILRGFFSSVRPYGFMLYIAD
jgi:hypothetical protein